MAASRAVVPRLKAVRTSGRADKSSPEPSTNFMERLPAEILLKILSYLDASALFTISHINKLFYHLANDNALWHGNYIAAFGKKKMRNPMCELLLKMELLEVRDGPPGYWKWMYFKMMAACDMNKCKSILQPISRHTGLPSQTQRILRNLHVTWELTVVDKSGHKSNWEPSWSKFLDTSVTLCWSGGDAFSDYQQIVTFQLHGIRRIALNCPGLKTPGWRSLMATVDMQTLTEGAEVIGQDKLVKLMLLQPGVTIGVWKGGSSIAFILFSLHIDRLVEKSTQGTSVCAYDEPAVKPPFDDIDPEYGLHGYHLHIALHDTLYELVSGSFPQLFCHRSQISDGMIQLTAINRTNLFQHRRLLSNVALPWQCEALQGSLMNCCIMSLTLLDEFRKPFKCISSPVSLKAEEAPVSYDYNGEHYLIHYQDSDCQVKMTLVHIKEPQQFVLISLVVYVSISTINSHFSRDY